MVFFTLKLHHEHRAAIDHRSGLLPVIRASFVKERTLPAEHELMDSLDMSLAVDLEVGIPGVGACTVEQD